MPQVVLDGVPHRTMTRDLHAATVHAAAGQARGELVFVAQQLRQTGVVLGRTSLGLRVDDHDVFNGQVTDAVLSAGSGAGSRPAAPLLTLRASGPVATARSSRPRPLAFGREILSGSVRRRSTGLVARCVTSAVWLRCGSRVLLSTPDPEFDGEFRVRELWARFDAAQGVRVEFVAAS